MNRKQRTILIVGLVLILGMMLFPPWLFVFDKPATSSGGDEFWRSRSIGRQRAERPAGYHFLFGQHIPSDETGLAKLFNRQPYELDVPLSQYVLMRIDSTRLSIQVAAMLLLVVVCYFILGGVGQRKRD